MTKIKGIKYISPVFDNSGYGKAARGNILALHKQGIPITLAPISFEQARPDLGVDGEILNELVNKDIDYNIVFIHTTPEFWSKHREPDKINVGCLYWETSKLHPDWLGYINNNVQKILVACDWNKKVFKDSGVEVPIGVASCSINMDGFNSVEPFQIAGVNKDAYVFYNIFQWTERKHPLAIIKAYWYEFKEEDNVALVLKTYRSSYDENEKDAIRTTIKRLKMVTPMDYYPPIYLITKMLSEDEILGLHTRGDCYASLDRGEGFGLSHFTAGAIGNPLIATGFGGVTGYAKKDNSYIVDYTLTPVYGMPWSPWYRGDQLWAEPDILHGAKLMRYVYENREESKACGQKLKECISENFTWEVIGKKLIEEIEKI
jgi:glycosyltransferase involved in cell wall biosynthesis